MTRKQVFSVVVEMPYLDQKGEVIPSVINGEIAYAIKTGISRYFGGGLNARIDVAVEEDYAASEIN